MLVSGGDLIDSFTRILPQGTELWKSDDVLAIVRDFGLLVMPRFASNPLETLNKLPYLNADKDKVQFLTDDTMPCDVSSTRVRKAIKEGLSIKYAVLDDVLEYIANNNLYM